MNARVFVLVLATGLFMAVWNADQRPMKVGAAKHHPARIIVSGAAARESLQIAAAEVPTEVIPQLADADTDAEPEPLPVPESEREDRDAAEFDATFSSVDDVIVFGNPAEERMEVSVSPLEREAVDSEAITAGESDMTASQSLDDVPLPKEVIPPIIPVPLDIPGGVWNVLSQTGETFRMTIERTSPGAESADRFCFRSAPDGDRWCFVRVAEPTLSVEPTALSRQVSTEFWSPTEKQ